MSPKSKTTDTLPSLRDLVDAGAQFGHRRSRSFPKAREFTFAVRDKVFVINLEHTREALARAKQEAGTWAEQGKSILFVGTKPQAAAAVKAAAQTAGQPYINDRWLGGTLTNFATIKRNLDTLATLEATAQSEQFEEFTKKERGRITKRITKLNKIFAGIKDLQRVPDALLIVDITEEDVATAEARKLGLPVIGLVDTNANPALVTHPIPVNDDSRRAIELVLNQLAAAIAEGKARVPAPKVVDEKASNAEKMEVETESVESGITNQESGDDRPVVEVEKVPEKKTVKKAAAKKVVKKSATKKATKKTGK